MKFNFTSINTATLVFVLIAFTISKASSQCLSKSFNISTTIVSVDQTNISIFYKINVIPSTPNATVYAKDCLSLIIFKYKKKEDNYYIIYEQDFVNLNYFSQFKNLNFMSEYLFDISYKQNIDNSQTEIVDVIKDLSLTTCFAEPSQPQNLRNQTNLDGSILFSWNESLEINAPSICYYLIKINDLRTGTESEVKTKNMNYLVSANDRKNNLRIDLSAINEAECYAEKYPFVKNCKDLKTGSKPYYISIPAYVSSTTTPPNTTQKPNNISISKYNVNNALLIFLSIILTIYNS
jgi:hypothetical protein